MKEILGKNLCDLGKKDFEELEKYIEDFICIKAYIENFIEANELDEEEVWSKIEIDYEESMSRYNG